MDALFDTTELEAILRELGENVKKGYIQKLKDHGRPTQENTLASTVEVVVDHSGTQYTVSLNLQDYWKYVEEGTRPHWPPPQAIMHWIEVKPVLPRPDEQGRIPSPRSLAYLIGRKIAREGTKGTHDLKETTDTLVGYYEDRIAEALGRAAVQYIERIIDDTSQLA